MKICFDFDSTLNNFAFPWIKWVNKTFKTSYDLNQITDYNFVESTHGEKAKEWYYNPEIYLSGEIEPLPGSQEIIKFCKEYFGENNVFILTMGLSKDVEKTKKNFCDRYYDVETKFVEKGKQTKSDFLEPCDILIDDYLKYIYDHNNNNSSNLVNSIVFDYKHRYGWSKTYNYKDSESASGNFYIASNFDILKNLLITEKHFYDEQY